MNAATIAAHRGRADTEARQAARSIVGHALAALRATLPDVHGAIVASVDGLPLAHTLHGGDPAGLAAMAATVAGLGKRIVGDMALGDVAESVVRGDPGYFAVYAAGPTAVLAVIAADGANLGRVHLEARRCAAKVAAALSEEPR